MAAGTVSACLRASTVKTALTTGTVPAHVLALTEGVMKAMLLSKLKISVCVAALALVAGVGGTGVAYRAVAQDAKPTESTTVSTSGTGKSGCDRRPGSAAAGNRSAT